MKIANSPSSAIVVAITALLLCFVQTLQIETLQEQIHGLVKNQETLTKISTEVNNYIDEQGTLNKSHDAVLHGIADTLTIMTKNQTNIVHRLNGNDEARFDAVHDEVAALISAAVKTPGGTCIVIPDDQVQYLPTGKFFPIDINGVREYCTGTVSDRPALTIQH